MKASLVAAVACLAFCAGAGAQEASEKSCAVMVKGLAAPKSAGGFDRAEAARFWTLVTNEIIDQLGIQLIAGHRVTVLEIAYSEAPRTDQHVGRALAQGNCNRIIQIWWDVDQDANGPYVSFTPSIMRTEHVRAAEGGGTIVQTRPEYRRAYRLVRTMEMLQQFKPDEFARQVFDDMEKAGALAALRR